MDVNMESTIEEKPRFLVSPYSSKNDNNFGEPKILPRVGDRYQVDIPPLMIARNDLEKQTDTIFARDFQNYTTTGLPIPITLVDNEDSNVKELENSEDRESGYFLIPGNETWSEIEYDSFLLCLYIFRKNFHLLKRFVQTKEMGDILGYYYGKFYRSNKYIRWSEGRKIRSRHIVQGKKLFTGWRLQELLSRLFSQVSGECKNKLTEISRAYGIGMLSLEGYVFALKDAVGINKLVSAVAIGKGKKDLTRIGPTKSNNHVRPEIPSGNSWSSVTLSDIIKFLTGDSRLSKAQSDDLFWEAVWPRLIARGWHCEQPRNHIYASSKNSLVFLVPGIKKYSRRKLMKGSDYFDSVTDVLKKVALEPALIELEFDEGGSGSGSGSDPQVYNDPGKSKERPHCYLQPPSSSCQHDLMKFTVLDTSLVKVRELRSLPADPLNLSSLSSEEPQGDLEENSSSSLLKNETENNPFVDSTESKPTIQVVKNHKDQSTSVSSDRSSLVKFKFRRKVKSLKSNCLVPVKEKCRLNEYVNRVENVSVDTELKKEESFASSGISCEEIGSLDQNIKSDLTGTHSSFSCGAASTKQNDATAPRQSMRNRPLTTRALEALECEFLVTTKKRRKGNTEAIIYYRHMNAADIACVHANGDVNAAKMAV